MLVLLQMEELRLRDHVSSRKLSEDQIQSQIYCLAGKNQYTIDSKRKLCELLLNKLKSLKVAKSKDIGGDVGGDEGGDEGVDEGGNEGDEGGNEVTEGH